MNCKQCDLCITRKNIVLGIGDSTADTMLIGEAPGYSEDKQGIPFVGESGKYLHSIIDPLFNGDIYITNIIKCRPPNNRDPSDIEIKACVKNILSNEIPYVNPIFIITAGAIATRIITGSNENISKLVGKHIPIGDKLIFPIYHPSYILRNEHLKAEYEAMLYDIANTIRTIQSVNVLDIKLTKNKTSPF